MKFGPRKPSLKRSIKARTTGRLKRSVKKSVNPFYGKKGMGWVNNPKKAAYNKVYNKTTFSAIPKTSRGKKSKTKNSFQNPEVEIIRSKDNYFVLEEQKITRKKWSYWWCLAVFILFIMDIFAAITMTLIAYFVIKHHNKKPEEEIKQVKKNLTDQEAKMILHEIESLSERLQKSLNTLNNILVPQSYFEALIELNEVIPRANYLVNKYHLPVKFDLGTQQDGVIADREVDDFKNILDEATNHFIKKYYHIREEDAQRLKTENGYNKRMDRNKEELLIHNEYLNSDHLEMIEKLWSEAKYHKN